MLVERDIGSVAQMDSPTGDAGRTTGRRALLRVGAALGVGGLTVLSGCSAGDPTPSTPTASPTATAEPTPTPTPTVGGGPLDARVADHGHYAWFALGEGTWARQSTPYDHDEGGSRWMATPTDDGGIRCLVRDIDVDTAPQSAGFDLRLGRLGDVRAIHVQTEVHRAGEFAPRLAVALYLDEDTDGGFFVWEDLGDGRESWSGFGGDEEAVKVLAAGGRLVVDDDTPFRLVNRDSATATLGQLKAGEIEYYGEDRTRDSGEFRTIDADTEAALYLGLVDNGEGDPVEATFRGVAVDRA
jgi:hypothetical protein